MAGTDPEHPIPCCALTITLFSGFQNQKLKLQLSTVSSSNRFFFSFLGYIGPSRTHTDPKMGLHGHSVYLRVQPGAQEQQAGQKWAMLQPNAVCANHEEET